METPQEIENKIRAIKPYLANEFGVNQTGYFVSFVKGDYDQDSDVEVLVAFNKKIGWKFFDLKDYLESVLDRKVDLLTERSLKKQWKQVISNKFGYI